MIAGETADGRTTAAGRTLVAGSKRRRIAEIGAACALHQVAPDGRHVAKLGGCGLLQRFANRGKMPADFRIVGDPAHLGQRADRYSLPIEPDGGETGEVRDIDNGVGCTNTAFGKIEKGRSAGQQHGGGLGRGLSGFVNRTGAKISEVLHRVSSAAWRTAATIWG